MQNPSLKQTRPWTFAGIMLSYWCNARCRFCYVSCSPQATDWVDPAEAVRRRRQLVKLATNQGKTMQIHLSGGEPFGNWPVLLEIAQRACAEGLTQGGSFQKVETNGFWASDPDIVRQRLEVLNDLGMRRLTVSADPYHQEFVDPQCVRTCVETAREVLGPDRVQVRWLDWYDQMQDLRSQPDPQREQVLLTAYETHRERLTGRASCCLANLLDTPTCQPVCRRGLQPVDPGWQARPHRSVRQCLSGGLRRHYPGQCQAEADCEDLRRGRRQPLRQPRPERPGQRRAIAAAAICTDPGL